MIVTAYVTIIIAESARTILEKPVNDQSYGVLDRYGITILYKYLY